MHALLVELEPDLLVGRDGDGRRQADVDDRARQEHLHEGDVAGRLDRVDLGRDAPASTCDLCSLIVEWRAPSTTFLVVAFCDLARVLRPRASGLQPSALVSTVLPSAVDASSGIRLIAGLPMKLATNRFTGWAKTCAGVSYCCRKPPFITAILSAMVTASSWSCVT